jgi:hypothetical protein
MTSDFESSEEVFKTAYQRYKTAVEISPQFYDAHVQWGERNVPV